MLDVLVGEALATRTLCEPYALSKSLIVGLAVGGVQGSDRFSTFDADGHRRRICPCPIEGRYWEGERLKDGEVPKRRLNL